MIKYICARRRLPIPGCPGIKYTGFDQLNNSPTLYHLFSILNMFRIRLCDETVHYRLSTLITAFQAISIITCIRFLLCSDTDLQLFLIYLVDLHLIIV